MDSLDNNKKFNTQLKINFLKSNEDHRLRLVEINGAIFAILHSPLESSGPIQLYCEDWSLVLLAPVKSKTNIVVSAINLICLNEISSEEGNVNIQAANRIVKFSNVKATGSISELGQVGEFQYNDDPGALLYFYKLFAGIINNINVGSLESFSEAQQQFIAGLCTLADKMENKPENLDISKVLKIWNIPNSV